MDPISIQPLADIPIPSLIAQIPKADIHQHAEWSPRLDRTLARQEGREPYNWRNWAAKLMATEPPGEARLHHLASYFPAPLEADTNENFVARVTEMLEEAAADNALLVEIRFGRDMADRPKFPTLFREAERQVQTRYPTFRAAAIPFVYLDWEPHKLERVVQTCLEWAQDGIIHGADVYNQPYTTEADWSTAYHIAERLATAGLDITVHVAEFSTANLTAALQVPGLTRLGHATYAGYHPHLLDMVARSGVTVECSLSSNVVLGATPSYEEHPIHRFVEAGIPLALCTDDPVRICTTIGREYAIAHALGFSPRKLLDFSRNAIRAASIAPEQRQELFAELDRFAADHL